MEMFALLSSHHTVRKPKRTFMKRPTWRVETPNQQPASTSRHVTEWIFVFIEFKFFKRSYFSQGSCTFPTVWPLHDLHGSVPIFPISSDDSRPSLQAAPVNTVWKREELFPLSPDQVMSHEQYKDVYCGKLWSFRELCYAAVCNWNTTQHKHTHTLLGLYITRIAFFMS